jgi:hypothetical protein
MERTSHYPFYQLVTLAALSALYLNHNVTKSTATYYCPPPHSVPWAAAASPHGPADLNNHSYPKLLRFNIWKIHALYFPVWNWKWHGPQTETGNNLPYILVAHSHTGTMCICTYSTRNNPEMIYNSICITTDIIQTVVSYKIATKDHTIYWLLRIKPCALGEEINIWIRYLKIRLVVMKGASVPHLWSTRVRFKVSCASCPYVSNLIQGS